MTKFRRGDPVKVRESGHAGLLMFTDRRSGWAYLFFGQGMEGWLPVSDLEPAGALVARAALSTGGSVVDVAFTYPNRAGDQMAVLRYPDSGDVDGIGLCHVMADRLTSAGAAA